MLRTVKHAVANLVVVHADESCLGNQNAGPSRGGAGAFVEGRSAGTIRRHDFLLSSPNTTNNQMALTGAIEVLKLLGGNETPPFIVYVSDSQYLVKGITEWVHNWERNGWRRKGGAVENLELWQGLRRISRTMPIEWRWVRGHTGHVKNEYADHLAVQAADGQMASVGLEPSAFGEWLALQRSSGKFSNYDPDRDFADLERQHAATA